MVASCVDCNPGSHWEGHWSVLLLGRDLAGSVSVCCAMAPSKLDGTLYLQVELEMAIDTLNPNYCRSKGEQIALNVDGACADETSTYSS